MRAHTRDGGLTSQVRQPPGTRTGCRKGTAGPPEAADSAQGNLRPLAAQKNWVWLLSDDTKKNPCGIRAFAGCHVQ